MPLAAGRRARYQRWDWARDGRRGWAEVPAGVPVVVEGVSSTDVRLGVPWDVTLWLDAPYEVRLARAMARDGEALREQWVDAWMPTEDAYEAAQRPQDRVDAVVDGGVCRFSAARTREPGRPPRSERASENRHDSTSTLAGARLAGALAALALVHRRAPGRRDLVALGDRSAGSSCGAGSRSSQLGSVASSPGTAGR